VNDDFRNKDVKGFFTYDKHYAKAIKNLNIILEYCNKTYKIEFEKIKIKCPDLIIRGGEII
jgi:hypothetical protein